MLELKTGEVYTALRARTGSSARGNWELIVAREEGKAKKEITIWVTNVGSGVTEGGQFRIKSIESVKYSARKDNNGAWRDDVSIGATVEAVGFDQSPFDFEDLPFDMGDNPFDEGLPL